MNDESRTTGQPPEPESSIGREREHQVSALVRYLQANGRKFTEAVLLDKARAEGYAGDVIEEARGRWRALESAAPTSRQARRWTLVAYLATFGLLAAGMLAGGNGSYGAGYIGTVILAVTLALALAISLGWLRSQGRKVSAPGTGLLTLLSIPIVLLVVVAGACLATGLPIPRSY